MSQHYLVLEIPEGELEKIFSELREAEEKIWKCYSRLNELGVLTIKREAASTENTSGAKVELGAGGTITI